jgi:hypothetical protein
MRTKRVYVTCVVTLLVVIALWTNVAFVHVKPYYGTNEITLVTSMGFGITWVQVDSYEWFEGKMPPLVGSYYTGKKEFPMDCTPLPDNWIVCHGDHFNLLQGQGWKDVDRVDFIDPNSPDKPFFSLDLPHK